MKMYSFLSVVSSCSTCGRFTWIMNHSIKGGVDWKNKEGRFFHLFVFCSVKTVEEIHCWK